MRAEPREPQNSNPEARDLDMEAIGRKRWAIAEGLHSFSEFVFRTARSFRTRPPAFSTPATGDAHVAITIFFADREPVGPYRVTVPARRTLHLRFNDLKEPPPFLAIPTFLRCSKSDVPIVVQHTRLDSRHAEVSLLSTTAYCES